MKYIESFPHEHQLNVLDDVIKSTFKILHRIYVSNCEGAKGQYIEGESQLIFPQYRDNRRYPTRVSEQELRFAFVEQLQQAMFSNRWHYSVETPTVKKYLFSEDGKKIDPCVSENGQSAMIDLTVHDSDFERIALFEFKANNPEEFGYKKDFCKLSNEPVPLTFFVMILPHADSRTEKNIREKVAKNIEHTAILFYCFDLLEGKEILQDLREPALAKLREMPGEHF